MDDELVEELKEACARIDRRHKHEWRRQREWVRVHSSLLRRAVERLTALQTLNEVQLDLNKKLEEELHTLRRLAGQRGARMQLLREWMAARGGSKQTLWWHYCDQNPEAKKWFDKDGVPCR